MASFLWREPATAHVGDYADGAPFAKGRPPLGALKMAFGAAVDFRIGTTQLSTRN